MLAVNNKIVGEQSGDDISSFEDKQIGMWFVKATAKEGAGIKSRVEFFGVNSFFSA